MKVKKLPVDPGPAGWNDLLPARPPAQELEIERTADWLVIGAGFAGLSAAMRFAQLHPGDKTVVLEAARVGEGPAGRNSGFMIDLPHDLASDNYSGGEAGDRTQIADNRFAIEFARALADQFGMSGEAFDLSGKINGAASEGGEAHIAAYSKHLTHLNEPWEWYDADKMRQITGTDYYRAGLYTPGSAILQPALYMRLLAEGLQDKGVDLYERSPVLALDKKRGAWVASTPKGKITAPKVVLAVNGHLESFGHMRGRLMHVFTYASMTRALTSKEIVAMGGERVWGLTPADPMGSTVRRIAGIGGDRVVIRNRFTFDPSLEVSDRKLERATADHDQALVARFPALDGVEMAYRWGGRLCLSWNNVQVVRPLRSGLWSACCQLGLGTAKGTLAGVTAAEAASDIFTDRTKRLMDAPKPSRLPPKPVAKLGAKVRLWRGERAAGPER